MVAEYNLQIPVLTEAVNFGRHGLSRAPSDLSLPDDREALIAELQTQIAAGAFALTDDIIRTAFAEMEASIYGRITSRLRHELPEMIDKLLRERLGEETDY
jgi:Arc/MetJ-type ribon-helix-helix transcriptional regulator